MTETNFKEGFSEVAFGTSHAELNEMGEREVRNGLNTGKFGDPGSKSYSYVDSWLKDAEFARLEEREKENSANSKKALQSARSANIWAAIATFLSAVALWVGVSGD